MQIKRITAGMPTFLLTWLGQVVSLFGSGLTSFALGIWVFERSGSVTAYALIGLFAVLPRVIFSPLAGVLVDRWDRRKVMLLSDAGAGLSTLFIVVMLWRGELAIWQIYLASAANSLFGAFQWPAYTAVITQLVPKHQLGRVNGMLQFGRAAAEVFAPALAGVLVLSIQLQGVILIDVATFLFAVLTLLLARFPSLPGAPAESTTGQPRLQIFRQDLSFGWRYISARPGLLNLLIFLGVVNFIWGMVGALIVPMILNFTGSDQLGAIITIAGTGMLSGSILMSAWGGPKRRINGVLLFELLSGLCFILMGIRPAFALVALGAFGAHVTIAIVFGSNQALWQTKVAPQHQGRVFATQQMFASGAAPLAYLLAGPLAERIFEPLLTPTGALATSLGPLLGLGPGRGIGLLFVCMGLVKMGVSLLGVLNTRVRRVEDELPDAIPGD